MVDVVLGKNNDTFGIKLANALGVESADFRTEYYPDGENAPRVLPVTANWRGKMFLLSTAGFSGLTGTRLPATRPTFRTLLLA